jgi:transcriptional regulator with XRE-family HTH domain
MIYKKALGERLKELEKEEKLSGRQIALRIGADVSYYNRARNGNGLSLDYMYKLVQEFGLTRSWLALGEGNMYANGRPRKEGYKIPLWDVGAAGGRQIVANMDGVTEPVEWIDAGQYKDATGAMYVYNDSMAPKYKNRDKIAYKDVADRDLILYGEDYVIQTSEYQVIKNIQKSGNGLIMACSYNTETWEMGAMKGRLIHEPFEIPLEKITGLCLVLGTI